MMRLRPALLIPGVLLVITACTSGTPSPSASASPTGSPGASPTQSPNTSLPPQATPTLTESATPAPSDDLSGLVDREWILTVVGEGAIPQDPPITITFGSDGQANGSGGCNSYGGDYTIDGGNVTFGPLLSTKMACVDANVNQNEQAFFAALDTVETWGVADDKLILTGPQGTDPLIFEPLGPVALPEGVVGPTWLVTRMGETDLPADAGLTATFGDDGIVYGDSGCNEYSGAYTLDGTALAFGGLATTDMFCEGPAGSRETSFHQAVAVVMSWRIADGQLELLDANGVTILGMTPTR